MPVEDKYINSAVVAGSDSVAEAYKAQGSDVGFMRETFEVAAADDDGSVYRLFKDVNPHLVIKSITIYNDAITSGTDYDVGLYQTDLGAVIDKDAFGDGISMASARAVGSGISGLSAVDVANLNQKLYEFASETIGNIKKGYDIALTANTVGSAAGTITVEVEYVQGV